MDIGYMSLELGPWIRTSLRLVHFFGVILGVGGATLLDLIIFKFCMIRRIEETSYSIIVFSSKIIFAGLFLLWVSGISFFVYYGIYDIAKIYNPKLIAKISIVLILSSNAFLVHHIALPQIKAHFGKHLLDGLSDWQRFLVIFVGTLSAISWYVPVILGTVTQFNNTIPAETFLLGYIVLVALVNIVVQLVIKVRYG